MEHPIQTSTKDPEVVQEDDKGMFYEWNIILMSLRSANWLGADVYKYHHTIETPQ